jgi:hypothetical protein
MTMQFFADRLREFVAGADDFLFELAGKTKDEDLHYLYLDTISRLRNKREALTRTFSAAFTRLYRDCVASGRDDPAKTVVDPATIERLLLSGDDDVESAVAIKNLASRVEQRLARKIAAVGDCFAQTVHARANPLAPLNACIAWKEATDVIHAQIKSKYVIYKLFSKFVLSHLEQLYDHVIGVMSENGITPRTKAPVVNTDAAVKQIDTTASGEFSADGFTREVVLKRVMEILKIGTATSNADAGKRRQAIIEALTVMQSYLDVLQSHAARQAGPNTSGDLVGLFGRLLTTACGENLRQEELDTIDLLRVMLDVTLDDKRIEARARELMSRLQLPLLKVAFLDRTFFDDSGHAGRRLLQVLAEIGLAGGSSADAAQQQRIEMAQRLVTRVVTELSDDVTVLEHIVDTSPLTQRGAAEVNRQVIDPRDAAKSVATQIAAKIRGRTLPESMRTFLHTIWIEVLLAIRDKKGSDSEEWTSALKAVDELATVAQKHDSPLHHDKVVEIVPGLLCKLQSGLALVSCDRQQRENLFNTLLKIHARSIQARKAKAAESRKATPQHRA